MEVGQSVVVTAVKMVVKMAARMVVLTDYMWAGPSVVMKAAHWEGKMAESLASVQAGTTVDQTVGSTADKAVEKTAVAMAA